MIINLLEEEEEKHVEKRIRKRGILLHVKIKERDAEEQKKREKEELKVKYHQV